jgi:hypothetical protein
MASTRNINTNGDYAVKKMESVNANNYLLYHSYSTNDPAYFVRGANPSIYAGQLDHNAIDVESTLRGIMSTNLEGPSFKATPKPTHIKTISYFDVNPIYIPAPYKHSTIERPLYLS